jgi:hypothetical protein
MGTANPISPLHVYSTGGNDNGEVRVEGTTLPSLLWLNSGVIAYAAYIDTADSNKFKIGNASSGVSSAVPLMTITSGGNVGIGTTSPQATLDVNGFARLALNSSAPATCSSSNEGAIALTHLAQVCICDTTPAWHILNTGTACSW